MSTTIDTVLAPGAPEEIRFQRYRFHATSGVEHAFERRLIYVGAEADNDLVIDDPTVSRVHARLEFDGRGFLLRDLTSKNGTRINGVAIQEAYLENGVTVAFGTSEWRFVLESESVEVSLARRRQLGGLVGESSQMREIFAMIERVAPRDLTVLVEGESGTGKELAARAIHQYSSRASGPFVVFDCSAVSPNLVESELFGHVAGAFTGAVGARDGVFEQATGGTLLLDELGELPRELQPKLLRVLENGEVKPVGSGEVRKTDVRLVAATNRRLDDDVKAGVFREDLFFRLAVLRIRMPPLRQRSEDIPILVQHFLDATGREDVHVGFETMRKLQSHPWPGNARELRNYVERALVLSGDDRLETRFLMDAEFGEGEVGSTGSFARLDLPYKESKALLLENFERRYWTQLLNEVGWNISEAARRGEIHRKSLEYLVKKHSLREDAEVSVAGDEKKGPRFLDPDPPRT